VEGTFFQTSTAPLHINEHSQAESIAEKFKQSFLDSCFDSCPCIIIQ